MHIYMTTFTYIYICMCIHLCMPTNFTIPYHTYFHTYVHAYLHSYLHAYIQTYLPTYIHTYIYIISVCVDVYYICIYNIDIYNTQYIYICTCSLYTGIISKFGAPATSMVPPPSIL